jgi:hypothetical protein
MLAAVSARAAPVAVPCVADALGGRERRVGLLHFIAGIEMIISANRYGAIDPGCVKTLCI